MAFNTQTKTTTFKKAEFFRTELGKHFIRFLQPTDDARTIKQHYIKHLNVSIECPGEDCPICNNNRRLITENPDIKPGKIPGINFPSTYHHINILDRTAVKICPKEECAFEVKADMFGRFPSNCPKCNTLVATLAAQPSNKVKVYSIPDGLAKLINQYESSQLDAQGETLPISSYDYQVKVVPQGERKITDVEPVLDRNDAVNVPSEFLFDLNTTTIKLEPQEINDLLRGHSLKDIFAARKAKTASPEVVETTETTTANEVIEKAISELYAE